MTAFQEQAAALLGPKGFLTDPAALAPHIRDWRGIFQGAAIGMALPASTAEAAALVRLCRDHGISIVPQGGNTGLSGAATPDAGGNNLVVNMRRMNRIRALDPLNNTIVVEAGCILADIQSAAAQADRLFPLSLAAEGSCQIGGNLSTNAGGINVLRYGNARDLTLGLEVVLADGSVLDVLGGLRKDNTGYDLKQFFIGAEGTLGLITAASLKLFPALRRRATALVALGDIAAAPMVLARCRAATADQLVSFELLPRFGLALARQHGGGRLPLDHPADWFLLIEAGSPSEDIDISGSLERALGEGMAAAEIADGLLAESEAQRRELWRLREAMVEAQPREGAGIKHDISVPVAAIPAFIRAATEALAAHDSSLRPLIFGHVGDGNLHFNVLQPAGADPAGFQARTGEINRLVHDCVTAHQGSISAEHGIGQLRREELARLKSPVVLAAMRAVKQALDPDGLFNPGKVL
ncbi:D-lactate dehydrogenase (cytochrome) [Dongia mobilis]|uniref:D-lactate dehydrogenase (Cytochrome) n=1 Tax=Dongia mobilis TaxID=578943 RepID=A0A4R6WU58_9PROT|nr:FAD-binding oxidoreductase [Dongia mobilis]TDQ83339.1 D-lactate dehydrogenase (cytochrome) [Dongia mobilis]